MKDLSKTFQEVPDPIGYQTGDLGMISMAFYVEFKCCHYFWGWLNSTNISKDAVQTFYPSSGILQFSDPVSDSLSKSGTSWYLPDLIIAINSPPANLRVFRNIFIGTERALKRPMTNDNQSHPYHPVRHKALNVSVFVLDFVFVFFGHEWWKKMVPIYRLTLTRSY